jgi:hypothetical protein
MDLARWLDVRDVSCLLVMLQFREEGNRIEKRGAQRAPRNSHGITLASFLYPLSSFL